MKDRFKFRLFFKDMKSYFDNGMIYLSKNGKLVSDDGCSVYEIDQKKYIVEQCTGLKDKNGKLIYEGDVILVPYLDPIFCGVWNKENTEKSVVEFYKGCWIVRYLCDNKKIIYLYDFEDKGEVIGNIHENPELVED